MARIGKALGVAYVNIRGDSKKLKGDLDSAKTQVIAAGKRMALGIGVVSLAVAGIGIAIKNLSKEWIKLANEQEAVEKRLMAVVKSTGYAAGLSAKQMIDMAGAMQKVTTVGDETIIAGMAILATFKQVRTEGFERATMAALDMSEVMQQDLRSAIVMIGKALNDPIANLGALSRNGVTFNKEQKELIKTLWASGDAYGAQSIMLKEIESQFGGAAKAARETFGGSLDALNGVIGDFKEEFGFAITKNEVFIQAIKDTEKALLDMIPDIQNAVKQFHDWVKANKDFIKQDIPGYIKSIGIGIKNIKSIYDSLPDGMMGAAGAGLIGWILFGATGGAQIAAMIYAINSALKALPIIDLESSGLGDFWKSIKEAYWALDDLVQAILGNRKGFSEDIRNLKIAAKQSLEQQFIIPEYITITPFPSSRDVTTSESPYTLESKETMDVHIHEWERYNEQLAKTAEWKNKIYAFEGIELGETDVFMDMADAHERAMEIMEERTISSTNIMADAFTGWAVSYSRTLNDMLWDSKITFDGIFESFGRMLTQMIIQQQMSGLAEGLITLLTPSAKGNVFSGPGINAYSNSIVDRPTIFQFAKGVGIMGESGSEAILPLTQTPSGNLGVSAIGSDSHIELTVNVENNTRAQIQQDDVRIMQVSPGKIVANLILQEKMNSRSWRQGMGLQ